MFFIGVFGIEENAKELGTVRNSICPVCGRYASAQVVFQYTFFHFFFIPLFKWNKSIYIRLSCCGALYTCDKETAGEFLKTGEIDFNRCSRMNQESEGGRCPWCLQPIAGGFAFCPYCGKRL